MARKKRKQIKRILNKDGKIGRKEGLKFHNYGHGNRGKFLNTRAKREKVKNKKP
jgi:hypothetical protein